MKSGRLLAGVAAAAALGLLTAAGAEAIQIRSDPGSPIESRISSEIWAEVDSGSLATYHRGLAPVQADADVDGHVHQPSGPR